MGIPCFLVVPSDYSLVELRRYAEAHGACPGMPGDHGYHNAGVVIGRVPTRYERRDDYSRRLIGRLPTGPYLHDPRWPTKCKKCDYVFTPEDRWQVNQRQLWCTAFVAGASEWTQGKLPAGAIFNAWWLNGIDSMTGADGLSLMCVLPDGHQWLIDGEANNCTRKGDLSHKCWCRHGEPPMLTVDKSGNTCDAGAGSIASPGGWHGFLRNGELVT